ncbi:autotransporter outer membrane beta-barrel domain-containing protein [Citrobacter sp. ANG330]|uniref:autotransporter outer membrane beta-barrel domain-containing protein n=1 Tax=Citrobacter sp. ANG330 TaxID=3048142 RepID=UPI0039C34E08
MGVSSVYLNAGTMTYTGDSTSRIGGWYGILAYDGTATINNSGRIDVVNNGIFYQNNATGSINNQAGGLINSSSELNAGIEISTNGVVDISNAGEISGNTGILFGSAGHSLLNSGLITGTGGTAISLTGGNNTLTFDTGSQINGDIASVASGNTLTLKGSGTLDSNLSGLDSITGAGNSGETWQLDGVISTGTSVNQTGNGETRLNGLNTYSGGSVVDAGTLNAANVSGLGTGSVTINNGGTLELSYNLGTLTNTLINNGVVNISGASNTLNTSITGTGINRISGSGTQITGDYSGFSGSWDITRSGQVDITEIQNLGGSPVLLDGLLTVGPISGDMTFANALTANGSLRVIMNLTDNTFDFTSSVGNAFTGTLELNRGTMALEGDNISALSNATLSLGNVGIATLDSDQTIGNLTFNGGTLDVAMSSLSTPHTLTVNNLNVDSSATSNAGVVNLQISSLPSGSVPGGNFLDQDNVLDNSIQVVKATTVSSPGKQLTLLLNNVAPVDKTELVSDGFGHNDVLATYGNSAVMSDDANAPGGPGLYAGYMLKALNSQSTVVLDTTGASNTAMSAQLTGVGDFEFRANNGTLTVLNSGNNYQGKTQVTSGTLQLGGNNALGQTSALNVASGATTDINGYSQTIGELNGAAGSTLALNQGTLTITNGGQSDGALTGGGNLTLNGGELVISNMNSDLNAAIAVDTGATVRLVKAGTPGSGAMKLDGTLIFDGATSSLLNPFSGAGAINLMNKSDVVLNAGSANYSGAVDIASASRLTAQQASALGSASIVNNGELVLNASDSWAFNNAMSGSGVLTKEGNGMVTLASGYGHTGGTHVAAGTLALDTPAASLSGGGPVTVDDGATLGGYGTVIGDVTSQGTIAAGDAITALTGGAGNLTIQGNLDNFNTVNLAGNTVGNTLTVTGNYTAHSTLVLNTVLGGDNARTDKLIVQGNTSGNTDVYVNNKGGSGMQTDKGIQIIQVDGESDGNFTLANRVVTGAYDYKLLQGTPTVNDGNWYLRVPLGDSEPVPVRPEAGAYLAGQAAAIEMFSQSLYDRVGESLFVSGNGQQDQAPSAWIRVFGSRTDSRSAGQIDQNTWSNGMQLGFDLANNLQVQNRWQIGVMAGYGKARTANETNGESYDARSNVKGYSVGLYGTWFADSRPGGTGPYIDTWLQHGWYSNNVQGEGLPEEKFDSRTQSISLEGGWAFNLLSTSQMDFFIQPQEQIIYTRYDADDVTEANGTKVKSQNDGGFNNRLGMRVYGYSSDAKGHQWKPFIEANWLYSSYGDAITMDDTRLDSDTPKHRYEVKTGLEAKLANQWSMWGNIGTQQGGNGYHNIEGGLGVKYTW